MGLRSGGRSLKISSTMWIQCTNVTDAGRQQRPRLRIASRGPRIKCYTSRRDNLLIIGLRINRPTICTSVALVRLSAVLFELFNTIDFLCNDVFIHAEHVVQSAWILFSLWMYVCMFVCLYVSALERKRLIGMT